MRSLYLVRHGKPQYPDEHSYCVGQTDFSLSMLGHLQAVLLNEELSDKISRIYCSPLLRAGGVGNMHVFTGITYRSCFPDQCEKRIKLLIKEYFFPCQLNMYF